MSIKKHPFEKLSTGQTALSFVGSLLRNENPETLKNSNKFTHCNPMLQTFGFLTFSGSIEIEHWAKMGETYSSVNLKNTTKTKCFDYQ